MDSYIGADSLRYIDVNGYFVEFWYGYLMLFRIDSAIALSLPGSSLVVSPADFS
jgi:hypothetical protein